MSRFSKALVLVAAALLSVSFAANPPRWDVELIFDDFDDVYGDGINRTCLGAVKAYSATGSYTKGNYGYWYTYSGTTGEVLNLDGEPIATANIKTAFDKDVKCLHAKFNADPTEEGAYAAIGANLFLETDFVDLSKMTALVLKAKGTGNIRVVFKSKYFKDNKAKYSWGDIGYSIVLKSAWETINIPVADILPAMYSDAESDGVDWADCKTGIQALTIELDSDAGAKNPAEFWIDSIVFKGMKYQDIVDTTVAITTKAPLRVGASSSFSISNNAISYTISQSQNVSFSILDLSGNVVSRVVGGTNAGSHTVALPALTAGNYVVKMNGVNSTPQSLKIVK